MRIENFTKVSLSNINSITPIIENQLSNSGLEYPPGTETSLPILDLEIYDGYSNYVGSERLVAMLYDGRLIAFRYMKSIGVNRSFYIFPLVEGSISLPECPGLYFGVNSLYKWNYIYLYSSGSGQGRYTANVADINMHVSYDMIEYIDSNMSGGGFIDVSFNNDSFEIFGIKPSSESGRIYVSPEFGGCLSNIFNILKTTVTNIYPSEGPAIEYLDMSRIDECVDMIETSIIKSSQPMGGLLFCKQLHYEQYDPATSTYMGSEIVDESKLFGITDGMYPDQGIVSLIYSCQLYPVIDQGEPASADTPDFFTDANCIVYPLKSEFYYRGQSFSFPEINKWYMVYYMNNSVSYHEVVKVPKMNVEMDMLNFESLADSYDDTIVYSGDVYFAHNRSSIFYYTGTSYLPIYKGHELYELVSYMFNTIGCSNKDNEPSTLERLNMTDFPNEFRNVYSSDWYMESAIELISNRGGITGVCPRLTTRLNYYENKKYFTLTYNLTSGSMRGMDFLQLHYFIEPTHTYIQGTEIQIDETKTGKWYAIETRISGHVFINVENPYFFVDADDLRTMSGSKVYNTVKHTDFEFLDLDYNSVRLYFNSISPTTGYQVLQRAIDTLGVIPEKTVCDGNHGSTTPGTPEVGPSTVSVEELLNSIARNIQEATGNYSLIKGSDLPHVIADAFKSFEDCNPGSAPAKEEIEKEVMPTKQTQVIEADDPSTQTLSRVTVHPIPENYIIPYGSSTLTSNNTVYDVTQYSQVRVSVPSSGGSDNQIVSLLNGTISSYTDTTGMTSVRGYAFMGCSNLSYVEFPNCTSIGSSAFMSCSNLKSFSFPACEVVRESAFARCSRLTNVDLPMCKSIYDGAFSDCSSLTNVTLPECLSIKGFSYCIKLDTLYVPKCKSVGMWGFASCSSLKTVDLPSCTNIDTYAFSTCSSLSYISIPLCSSIGTGAFYYCISLENIDLPCCSSIGRSAFAYCSKLTSISIPACTRMSSSVFYGCTNLASVYLNRSTVPSISSSVFYNTPIDNSNHLGYFGSIYVRESLVESFKAASNWSNYKDRIVGYSFE